MKAGFARRENQLLSASATLDNGLRYSLISTSNIPDEQVADTIALMSAYAVEDSTSPEIVSRAQRLKARIDQGLSAPAALFEEANNALVFTLDQSILLGLRGKFSSWLASKDANVIEVLVRPRDVELMRASGAKVQGDCDDFSMYVISLALALRALGVPISEPRFVTVAADSQSDEFSHVYTRLSVPSGTVAIDASHGEYPGWEVPRNMVKREREWSVNAPGTGFVLALIIGGFMFWRYATKRGKR